MPFQSRKQMAYLFSQEPEIAKRWSKAYPVNYSKLPERKKPKGEDKDVKSTSEKKAFILGFLSKCAAEGLTTPAQIAAAAEKLAGIGDIVGNGLGAMALGGAAGIAIPTALGYAGGRTIGAAGNAMDRDDADSLRLRAEANAYRRRAIEARLGSQVRKIVATDPKKYVVLS